MNIVGIHLENFSGMPTKDHVSGDLATAKPQITLRFLCLTKIRTGLLPNFPSLCVPPAMPNRQRGHDTSFGGILPSSVRERQTVKRVPSKLSSFHFGEFTSP